MDASITEINPLASNIVHYHNAYAKTSSVNQNFCIADSFVITSPFATNNPGLLETFQLNVRRINQCDAYVQGDQAN